MSLVRLDRPQPHTAVLTLDRPERDVVAGHRLREALDGAVRRDQVARAVHREHPGLGRAERVAAPLREHLVEAPDFRRIPAYADVTDEHELRTGSRQEGLLFAALMLIAKAASGLGPLVGGLVLKIAHFPENASA